MIRPIINYFGGKRRIAKYLVPFIRDNLAKDGTYYEPFVGGGAIWLALEHDKNVIADISPDLINMYECIQKDPDKILPILNRFPNNRKAYNQIRNFDRNPNFPKTTKEFQAARFIYLTITGFGSIRYNSKGQLNMSYFNHPERKEIINLEDYNGLVERLKFTKVMRQSFKETLKLPVTGDFVYLDPPYVNKKYKEYWTNKFTVEDMKMLHDCCIDLNKKGVTFAFSHAESEEIYELFKDFNCQLLTVGKPIDYSQTGTNRKETEFLITNV